MKKTYNVIEVCHITFISRAYDHYMADMFRGIYPLVCIKYRALEAHMAEENDVRGEDHPQ